MKFNLTEEEKNRIHNLYNLKSENKEILSESILTTTLSRLFKGFSKAVSVSVENSINKVIHDVIIKGGGKSVRMSVLRNK